jgi:tetraacyldisaccharide 4'-kinase
MMNLYPDQQLFFGTVVYGIMRRSDGTTLDEALNPREVVLGVTGVSRPAPFYDELERRGFVVDRMNFSDHHPFTESDIKAIQKRACRIGAKSVITTEKDNTRMPEIPGLNVYYIPIELRILLGQEKKLNQTIIDYVAGNK